MIATAGRSRGGRPPRHRPAPERNPEFAHLGLDRLREYRRELQAEESRVSYWRRLLQARLDLLAAMAAGGPPRSRDLSAVFDRADTRSSRTALLDVLPVDDLPPLPNLAALWGAELTAEDAETHRELRAAERQLSDYRAALHQMLDAATAELIARYRDQPLLCLSALPGQPARAAVVG
jgi:hypothetical protein